MKYRIFKLGKREPLDELELHVLARAYYAAWQCMHGSAPVREHVMPRLGLLIDFGAPAPAFPANGDAGR